MSPRLDITPKRREREFAEAEWKAILAATLKPQSRPGEITQLRAEDVQTALTRRYADAGPPH